MGSLLQSDQQLASKYKKYFAITTTTHLEDGDECESRGKDVEPGLVDLVLVVVAGRDTVGPVPTRGERLLGRTLRQGRTKVLRLLRLTPVGSAIHCREKQTTMKEQQKLRT